MEQLVEEVKNLEISEDPEVNWLKNSVLGKELKIILTDFREICGKLQCVDHLSNIVLINSTEKLINKDLKRNLGSIIVPSKGISQIFLLTEP